LAEGEERARREKFEHARMMKADGFTDEQIEKYGGLLRGEIEGL
jgi:hypothetical protein